MSRGGSWALACLAGLALGACRSQGAPAAKEAVMSESEWKGQFSGARQGARKVVRSDADWRSLWAAIGQEPPPAPDFKTQIAVAVLLGERRTGGYRVQWLGAAPSPGAMVVRYKEMKPEGMAMQALTQPYAVKVFPLAGGEVRVEESAD